MTRLDVPPPDEPPLGLDDVGEIVSGACFGAEGPTTTPGRIGLEVERFPVRVGQGGRPAGRVFLGEGVPSSLGVLDELAERSHALGRCTEVAGVASYPVRGGGRLTFEPGGALEHATAPHATVTAAMAEIDAIGPELAEAYDDAECALVSVGVDPFHGVEAIPLQLETFRYSAMAEYFASRGGEGRVIMRHTCSIQVNFDLGPPGEIARRWDLLNLLSPLVTATFANSPSTGSVCARALAWQGLDAGRCGFPRLLVDGSTEDPTEQMVAAALDAEVLLVRRGARAVPGRPGWTFGHWLRDGHPDHGRPTASDLRYHLTTLFHEVRPRGAFEVRSIDAVPSRWRVVPVVLLAGAVEDPQALDQLSGLLERARPELPEMWERAARQGVDDPAFCARAVEVWSYAMEGAGRLPDGHLPPDALTTAEQYLERFTLRGRCPADELRARLDEGEAGALAWAAEPVPERAAR